MKTYHVYVGTNELIRDRFPRKWRADRIYCKEAAELFAEIGHPGIYKLTVAACDASDVEVLVKVVLKAIAERPETKILLIDPVAEEDE